MTEVRLRARTVSEIVDAAFELYRHDPGKYILLMAFAITPQIIAQILIQPGTGLGLGTMVVALITLLVSAFTYTMGSAAIMKFGAAVYLGYEADLEATLKHVIPKVATIIWAGFLKMLLYILGFMVFFVGEFYVAARFFGVTAAIVLEDADTGSAFTRSTELSNGRKGHILTTLLLVWVIYIFLSLCLLFATGVTKSQVLALILNAAYQIVAYPIFGLTTMLLYYDCRIRSEGFDIEQMAASLGVNPGAGPGVAGAAT